MLFVSMVVERSKIKKRSRMDGNNSTNQEGNKTSENRWIEKGLKKKNHTSTWGVLDPFRYRNKAVGVISVIPLSLAHQRVGCGKEPDKSTVGARPSRTPNHTLTLVVLSQNIKDVLVRYFLLSTTTSGRRCVGKISAFWKRKKPARC